MPIDVVHFLVPADRKLVARARKRGGEVAARAMIERISRRAVATTVETNRKIRAAAKVDPSDPWPPAFLAKGSKR
jgi:hypothetical protein